MIDLGKHKLRFLETPHVHHWDSMMLFDETTKSVFPSDLFIQPGDQPPVVTENLGSMMCEYYREIGIFAHDQPVRDVVDRIEALDPDWIHGMHGGSLGRETIPYFTPRCGRSRSAIRASCSAEMSCRDEARYIAKPTAATAAHFFMPSRSRSPKPVPYAAASSRPSCHPELSAMA